jgi:HSP20 family protein
MAGRSMVPSWRNTSLSPWDENTDPFSEFRREMNRLLDNAFSSFGFPGVGSPAVGGMAAPKIDVSESENEIRVAAELGGIDEKNIEVMLTGDMLTIRGERRRNVRRNSTTITSESAATVPFRAHYRCPLALTRTR